MKVLMLTADGFEDSEMYYPYYRILEEGGEVDVASVKAGAVTGKHGYVFDAGKAFSDVRPADYDALVIPGGKAPEKVRLDEDAVAAAREIFEAGKPVAAICHGGQVLISAGVVRGRKVTGVKGIRDDLTAAGADYLDKEVVVDGNLITSRHPADLPAFAREIIKALG